MQLGCRCWWTSGRCGADRAGWWRSRSSSWPGSWPGGSWRSRSTLTNSRGWPPAFKRGAFPTLLLLRGERDVARHADHACGHRPRSCGCVARDGVPVPGPVGAALTERVARASPTTVSHRTTVTGHGLCRTNSQARWNRWLSWPVTGSSGTSAQGQRSHHRLVHGAVPPQPNFRREGPDAQDSPCRPGRLERSFPGWCWLLLLAGAPNLGE